MTISEAEQRRLKAELQALIAAVPTKAPIYLPTEKVPLSEQVAGMRRVKQLYDHGLDAVHRPRLRALRDQWKGTKRCFVIGNGPSLNVTDLSLLSGEVTFAVNGFFLKAAELDWKPTFYVVEDHLVAEDRAPWINAFKGPTKLFPASLAYVIPGGDDTIFFNHRPRKSYPHGFDFSLDAAEITYTGCTVTFTVLQLAAYLGFQEIYLIGVDADYTIPADAQQASAYAVGVIDMKSDDTNHFHPDYFGKGFRWHDPQVEKMLEAYAEARRTIETTSQRIYNATIGGKLEVFERREYSSLFCKPGTPPPLKDLAFPRLLVLDMTAIGNGSATGEIKANLLADWPVDQFIQIATPGKDRFAIVKPENRGRFTSREALEAEVETVIRTFAPDVVLYRPVADLPHMHSFVMRWLTANPNVPLVTWIMDDWPARLEVADPPRFLAMDADLRALFTRSAFRLSICAAMSQAFEARYGMPFEAFANGINAADWPPRPPHKPGRMKVRYAGGLAPDMNADAILRVARAVETLAAEGVDIAFEISTQPWWFDRTAGAYKDFKATRIEAFQRPFEAYASWLREADILLIAYNFNAETQRYVRYSMANKMPECLASGAVVLAHGPAGVASIDYLASTDAAVVVSDDSDAAVVEALRRLQADPDARAAIAARGRALAFERHDVNDLRRRLRSCLAAAAAPSRHDPSIADARATILRVAGDLLLDPEVTFGRLRTDGAFAATVGNALAVLPADDRLRLHYERVIDFTR